jgi:hypothetical protein
MGRRPSLAAPEPSGGVSDVWLLLADDASADAADMVRADLEARGGQVIVAHPSRLGPLPEADHAVLLLGWRLPVEASEHLLSEALRCVQELAGRADSAPRLWIVTSGGALASGLPPGRERNPVQAALWGFGRVVMNELPALRCTLIDVEADAAADMGGRLARELLYPDGTSEILLGGEGRHSLVLVEEDDAVAHGRVERFRLDFHVPGRLRNLLWLPDTEREPGEDLVEVRTMAVGLNFRDVMYLMGLLPDEALEKGFAGPTLGLEFSGVVTRVGAAVGSLKPGDHVMGFGPPAFPRMWSRRPMP